MTLFYNMDAVTNNITRAIDAVKALDNKHLSNDNLQLLNKLITSFVSAVEDKLASIANHHNDAQTFDLVSNLIFNNNHMLRTQHKLTERDLALLNAANQIEALFSFEKVNNNNSNNNIKTTGFKDIDKALFLMADISRTRLFGMIGIHDRPKLELQHKAIDNAFQVVHMFRYMNYLHQHFNKINTSILVDAVIGWFKHDHKLLTDLVRGLPDTPFNNYLSSTHNLSVKLFSKLMLSAVKLSQLSGTYLLLNNGQLDVPQSDHDDFITLLIFAEKNKFLQSILPQYTKQQIGNSNKQFVVHFQNDRQTKKRTRLNH